MRGVNRIIPDARVVAGLLMIWVIPACSATPTPNPYVQQSAATPAMPTPQAAANSAPLAAATVDDWTPVSSLTKKSNNADVKTLYDASAFQAVDFWLAYSVTPINSQQ